MERTAFALSLARFSSKVLGGSWLEDVPGSKGGEAHVFAARFKEKAGNVLKCKQTVNIACSAPTASASGTSCQTTGPSMHEAGLFFPPTGLGLGFRVYAFWLPFTRASGRKDPNAEN